MPEYIPANPVVRPGFLADRRPLPFPRPGVFSVARWALIHYLRHRGARRVLLPDYMCHEVANALRGHDFELSYYPLDGSFDPRLEGLESALKRGADAVVLTHFYGRLARNLEDAAKLCREGGAALVEDCVHLPFPHLADDPFVGDARLYTLRKTYPVPWGGTIVLREGQDAFADRVEKAGRRFGAEGGALLGWALKQTIKKGLLLTRLGWTQAYRDLSQDPLTPHDFAGPAAGRLLSMSHYEDALERRRANIRDYQLHAGDLGAWGEPLAFDLQRDVPYMLPLILRPGLDPERAVRLLMYRGVPAALGLALDPEVLAALPADHRYRRVLVLPVHQDLRDRHVRRIASVLRDTKVPDLVSA